MSDWPQRPSDSETVRTFRAGLAAVDAVLDAIVSRYRPGQFMSRHDSEMLDELTRR